MASSYIEKRSYKRIAVNITARFHCSNEEYLGTVTNLSEKGMFIIVKEISFPLNPEFEIMLSVEKELLHMLANIQRIIKSPDFCDGIGVEILSPPPHYVAFVDSLRTS